MARLPVNLGKECRDREPIRHSTDYFLEPFNILDQFTSFAGNLQCLDPWQTVIHDPIISARIKESVHSEPFTTKFLNILK